MIRGRVTPVVLLAIAAAALGAWGYSRLPGLSTSDTVYRTLQLFSVESDIPASGTPWQLDIARFLAPLAVAYAVLVAVLALGRDQVQRWRTRLFARGHVLIVGAGSGVLQLARALRGSRRVVTLDPTRDDVRDPAALRAARADRAAHVVVLTGDDSANLEVLAALRQVIGADRPVPIHVAIDAPRLWAELHRLPLQSASAQRRVEFVSIPDRTARRLVESVADAGAAPGAQRIVIRGAGPVVARLAVHLVRSAAVADGALVAIEGHDAAENLRLLRATDAWIFRRASVRAADGESDVRSAAAAFVCGLPEADALEAAVTLVRRVDPSGAVHVAVPDADLGVALGGAGVDLARIRLVSAGESLLDEDLLEGAAFETLARGKHADYVLHERARGVSSDENDALRPWEELDERYRQSNRRFADGVASVLASIGAELVPLTGRDVGELPVAPEVLERLAIAEHDRWSRDQRLDGWRPTDGSKDTDQKLHPLLKPWDELPESEREKDRDAIRALPALLASMGYELVLP